MSRLLAAVALFGLASGGLFSLIGIGLVEGGVADFWIGAISSVYFVGAVAGSGTAGFLILRIGHTRSFTLFALLAGGTTLALTLTAELEVWFVLRFLTGYAMGGYYLAIESWINHAATNNKRGRSLAIYECFRMGAIALSPLLLGLGDHRLALILAGLLFLLAIGPIGLAGAAAPQLSRKRRLPLRQLLGLAPIGLVACGAAGLLSSAFYGLGAVYGTRVGLPRDDVLFFMSVTWFAPLIVQIPIGRLADRMDRELVLLGVCGIAAAAAFLIVAGGASSLSLLLVLTFLVGGLSHPLYALGLGILNDRLPREEVVGAGATLLVVYSLGTSLGPALGSIAMSVLGPSGLYAFFATVLLLPPLLIGLAVRLRPRGCNAAAGRGGKEPIGILHGEDGT